MFQLENVNLAYEDSPVLQGLNLQIEEGEKVVLIGPSGVGKTTLLNRLYEMNKERTAFIHQDYALVPQLSVFHNVLIGRLDHYSVFYALLNLVVPQKKEVTRIREILESLGMADKLFRKVGQLSGGQRQRTAVARAMFRDSEILIADEPVSSIDPLQAGSVLNLLRETKCTVILSMHHVQLALESFDRIIGLSKGRILFDLPAEEVNQTLLRELFEAC